jgi:outer membrane biosynthesis protein TonB
MVMKRLFEAEDNGEISREERERLSKNYEAEMQQVNEELKKAELIVSLNELEEIRANIVEQFQQTLTETQSQIDLIIRELDIEKPEPEPEEPPKPKPKPRRRRPSPPPEDDEEDKDEPEEEEEPEEDDEEDEETSESRGRETVEDRLDRLKQDVLKELDELERLELEQ